ncbi:energy transducer TonB [Flavobacterium limnophilum]|uniref:energy transducer TonB n=1 Tax=Flavobacterium limnophilum TaxID=3003262 RepID=UPI00248325A1|nr:energy transducer TonB [Flavobacterium limnophilum]
MKNFFFLVVAFFSFQFADAQELLMETELVSSPDVTNPKFNGGEFDKFYEFINQHFNYATVKNKGDIVVAFTVNELGEVKKIKVLQFPNIEAASEIIRVLNISPKWEPAKRAGRPFSVEIKLPVNFQMKLRNH